jgi:hypothetical protein
MRCCDNRRCGIIRRKDRLGPITKDKFHTKSKNRLQELNLIQKRESITKEESLQNTRYKRFNKRIFRKKRPIQKPTAGDIVQ